MNVKHGRIWQNPFTDRQRSLLIHKSSNTTLTKHFTRRNVDNSLSRKESLHTSKLLIPDDFRDYYVLICRKDRVATTSLTRNIVQSFRTVTQADDFTHRWLLADWTTSLRGTCIYSVCLCGGGGSGCLALRANLHGLRFQTAITRKRLEITLSI